MNKSQSGTERRQSTTRNNIIQTEISSDMLVDCIKARKSELEQVLIEIENSLRDAPQGTIRIVSTGNSLQYYHRIDHSDTEGVYLKRTQDSFAAALAQKDYDYKLSVELRSEIKALDRFLFEYQPERVDEIFKSLHAGRKKLIRPARLTDEDYVKRWESVVYEKKTFEEDSPDYFTSKSERVRSKSEILIADALSRHNIPYRYEYPILIPGFGTVHPDFMCLNGRTRKEYVWEHNGMMSDSKYADNAINRIEKYAMAGYCPRDNLILTFESNSRPLSSRMIECNINSYLL